MIPVTSKCVAPLKNSARAVFLTQQSEHTARKPAMYVREALLKKQHASLQPVAAIANAEKVVEEKRETGRQCWSFELNAFLRIFIYTVPFLVLSYL